MKLTNDIDINYRKNFLNFLVNTYSKHSMSKQNYNTLLLFLSNEYKKDQNKEKYDTLSEILKNFYDGSIYDNSFINYSENLIGDHIRHYDMSFLVNNDLINIKDDKSLIYHEEKLSNLNKNIVENKIFKDSNNRLFKITKVGTLYFKHWNGLCDYINRYDIRIKSKDNTFNFNILSNINMIKMSNLQYCNSVLEVLLSENNISLSNSNGYIGEIIPNEVYDWDDNKFEHIGSDKYEFKINDEFKLVYFPEKVTVAKYFNKINK